MSQGKKRLVVLTGAGMSAESGLSTFRDADGLWENEPVAEVATHEAILRDPLSPMPDTSSSQSWSRTTTSPS